MALVSLAGRAEQTKIEVAERIIALSPHSVEMLFLLGAGDKIVGTLDYADYPEQAKAIPRIGGHEGIQLDRLLELEPDLVIVWQTGNQNRDIERIEDFGIPLYISETKRLADIPKELLELAELVGATSEGKALAEAYNKRLRDLRAHYSGRSKVRFFYQLWSDPLRTVASGSWINELFDGCGGENVFSSTTSDYPQVSLESVIEKQPQVIVVPSHKGKKIPMDMWLDWPEIPAVKNQQMIFFDGDLLHRFSYRTLDGMQQICERFDEIRNSSVQE
jgi:vitamin B12 transport system substrate-binding protein